MLAYMIFGIIIGALATMTLAVCVAPKETQAERDYYSGRID